jgi:hypothetical protein
VSPRSLPALVYGATLAFALAWSTAAALLVPMPKAGEDYNTAAFLIRHSWVKFALAATAPFRADLSEPEKDARAARFFELSALIAEQERVAGDTASSEADIAAAETALEEMRDERRTIENTVEEIIEGRLTALLEDVGLTRHLGGDFVWPPVNIEFEEPPAVLVTSPRDEIRRQGDRLLDGGLAIEDRVRLEQEREADGETSALVVDIGAIAMYPAIVPPRADYRSTLRTIAHEWVHHYLYFAPLGRNFYGGDKLVTLNETVANIAGDELGEMMYQRWPLERVPALVRAGAMGQQTTASRQPGISIDATSIELAEMDADAARFFAALRMTGSATPYSNRSRAQSSFDFGAEMRALRLEVDALLAEGKVEEAERVMEERRQLFVLNGYYIRRINQAYFAFHGTYADTPASSDPIGPKMIALRERVRSVEEFLEEAREITSESELDALLSQ